MFQKLPVEIVTAIADFLSTKDTGELAQTCQKCYYAALPHMWHELDISNANELSKIAHSVETNGLWSSRANQFVRQVALLHSDKKGFSPTFSASMFGITSTPSERRNETKLQESIKPCESISTFGRDIVKIFPHLSSLVVDFKEAIRNFYVGEEVVEQDTPFSGSFSLVNYKADHTKTMHHLLAPFKGTHHLKIQASSIISLCDDIDESILTDQDVADLATLGLKGLTTLELSYLDSDLQHGTIKKLLEGLPHLQKLELEWLFPPNQEEYQEICEVIQEYGSLYPEQVEHNKSVLQVHFAHHDTPLAAV